MLLRYTGPGPVTFTDPRVGEVHPGDVFEVPDDEADAFTSRADVGPNTAPPRPRTRRTAPPDPAPSPVADIPALTTEEPPRGAANDH